MGSACSLVVQLWRELHKLKAECEIRSPGRGSECPDISRAGVNHPWGLREKLPCFSRPAQYLFIPPSLQPIAAFTGPVAVCSSARNAPCSKAAAKFSDSDVPAIAPLTRSPEEFYPNASRRAQIEVSRRRSSGGYKRMRTAARNRDFVRVRGHRSSRHGVYRHCRIFTGPAARNADRWDLQNYCAL